MSAGLPAQTSSVCQLIQIGIVFPAISPLLCCFLLETLLTHQLENILHIFSLPTLLSHSPVQVYVQTYTVFEGLFINLKEKDKSSC